MEQSKPFMWGKNVGVERREQEPWMDGPGWRRDSAANEGRMKGGEERPQRRMHLEERG